MVDLLTIEGECNKCGSTAFSVPDDAPDDAWITCDGCGQPLITWGDYKSGAVELAKAELVKRFSKVKGFKPG
ncbi:hypothetical protein N0B51_00920 [Tsuneonella sp. YG55]|uniref:Uncharacterized protein n=1 Tax=Tsuneonella litorea TaxID=2976475 RepID=A0A9X2VZ59_9SPHN|nr:hypothetical protein [Tsuneonella litorea]MCT2557534.1 hypothetical protein [Tsuneonella litorea]